MVPGTPAEVLGRGFGDCKDQAVLLQQLLRAVSIPAHLALVASGYEFRESLPTMGQFNHMLIYVPGPGEARGMFIDTTDTGLDLRCGTPIGLADTPALVLDPAGPALVTVPPYPPGSLCVRVERRLALANGREIDIDETVRLSGYAAAFMRQALRKIDEARRLEWSRDLLSKHLGRVTVRSFRVENLDAAHEDLVLELAASAGERRHENDGRLFVRIPAAWERDYLEATPVTPRATAFRIQYPLALESVTRVRAPAGYAVVAPSNPPAERSAPFARWKAALEVDSGDSALRFSCALVPGEFRAEQYAAFVAEMESAIAAVAPEVTLERTGE